MFILVAAVYKGMAKVDKPFEQEFQKVKYSQNMTNLYFCTFEPIALVKPFT